MADILTASSIQELKERVNQELTRRKYYGNISSAAPTYNTPNNNTIAQANEINDNIVDKINLIDNTLLSDVIKNNPINYNYINNGIEAVGTSKYPKDNISIQENPTKKTTHGCNEACTGFCSITCGDKCSAACAQECKNGCGAMSSGNTDDYCSGCGAKCGGCASGCKDNCDTTCSGCGSFCGGACGSSGCSNACRDQQNSNSVSCTGGNC